MGQVPLTLPAVFPSDPIFLHVVSAVSLPTHLTGSLRGLTDRGRDGTRTLGIRLGFKPTSGLTAKGRATWGLPLVGLDPFSQSCQG